MTSLHKYRGKRSLEATRAVCDYIRSAAETLEPPAPGPQPSSPTRKGHSRTPSGTQPAPQIQVPAVNEALRMLAELIIWGDQNEPAVFEAFMERDMVKHLTTLIKRASKDVQVQVLQLLNILFQGLQEPTSRYFLLSNNHINEIISLDVVHTEEALNYYISLLKLLSLNLTPETIWFFQNEHRTDFPLLNEAVRLVGHEDTMVRTAVRSLTLHVFRVQEDTLQDYLYETMAPRYFAEMARSTVSMVEGIDAAIADKDRSKASSLYRELCDVFEYFNDILHLPFGRLPELLRQMLLSNVFIPLFFYNMAPQHAGSKTTVPLRTSLCLHIVAQTIVLFDDLIFVNALVSTLLRGSPDLSESEIALIFTARGSPVPAFHLVRKAELQTPSSSSPTSPSSRAAREASPTASTSDDHGDEDDGLHAEVKAEGGAPEPEPSDPDSNPETAAVNGGSDAAHDASPVSDVGAPAETVTQTQALSVDFGNALFEHILNAIDSDDDSQVLPALCLILAMLENKAVSVSILSSQHLVHPSSSEEVTSASPALVTALLNVMNRGADSGGQTRLVTSTVATRILQFIASLAYDPGNKTQIAEPSVSSADDARGEQHQTGDSAGTAGSSADGPGKEVSSTVAASSQNSLPGRRWLLQQSDRRRLLLICKKAMVQLKDMYTVMATSGPSSAWSLVESVEFEARLVPSVRLSRLLETTGILFPIRDLESGSVPLEMRLPQSSTEKQALSIKVFFIMRRLWQELAQVSDDSFPLYKPESSIQLRETVPLLEDVIACDITARMSSGQVIQVRRFIRVDDYRLMFLEPDSHNLGFATVRFIAALSSLVVERDSSNTRSLLVTIMERGQNANVCTPVSAVFRARLSFDNHIRCLTACQYIESGREHLRQKLAGKLMQAIDEAITSINACC